MQRRTRIRPHLRPLRPPLHRPRPTKARFFTRNSQLLLLSAPIPRPQLSFLGPISPLHKRVTTGQWQLSRLISTETKRWVKEQAWQGGKWTMWGSIFTVLGIAWAYGMTHELLDREFPAPPEWTHWSRFRYHRAKAFEVPEALCGVTDWALVGDGWMQLLERLENLEKEGKGMVQQEEGGIMVLGVGETGFDVSAKSEPWRRGYYETLMGCAKSAEHLDGKVCDFTRNNVFPPEYVIGPSNPNPKPTPPWRPAAPLEENCVPAYDPPETFYLKIMTTKGFSTRQRLDAAVAYADWLDFKGMHETAEEMIRWGTDIALAAVPEASAAIDSKTGTIRANAPVVTENVLVATTALGIHYAQTRNTSAALPILLSVLRARRAAPMDPNTRTIAEARPQREESPRTDIDAIGKAMNAVWSLLQEVQYPPAPPSGDSQFMRTPSSSSDEAAAMLYIGEILFASSKPQVEQGISWTRDATELAEDCIRDPRTDAASKKKCVDCLRLGLENWRAMIESVTQDVLEEETMLKGEARKEGSVSNGAYPSSSSSWKSYLGFGEREETRKQRFEAVKERWVLEEKELQRFERRVDRARLLDLFSRNGQPLWGSALLYW